MAVGDQHHVLATLHPGKNPGTHSKGGTGPVCMGLAKIKSLYHTRVRSPDRPAHSKSLYRLSRLLLKFISDFIDGKFAII
jgi:hypothetical protein